MRVNLVGRKISYYSFQGITNFVNDFYMDIQVVVPPNINLLIFVRITSPDGLVFKDTDFITPDAIGTSNGQGLILGNYTAPVDSFGSCLKGDYRFEIWTEQDAVPGSLEKDVDVTYSVCPIDLSANLVYSVDCFCRVITLTDATAYPPQTEFVVPSILELIPPTIDAGVTPPPIQDSNLDPITATLDYTNVTWTGTIDAYFYYPGSTDGVVRIYDRLTQQKEQKVDCEYNLCQLVSCIGTAYDQVQVAAAKAGGFSSLPQAEQDKWIRLNLLLQLHDNYITCGDFDRALSTYNQIKDITGCSCKVDATGPVPLSPICGGAGGGGGGITNVVGNTPIVVNVVGGIAYVSLSASFTSRFNALFNTTIQSSDPGTTIDEVLVGIDKNYTINPRTYIATAGSGISLTTNVITPPGVGQGEVTRFSFVLADLFPWVNVEQADLSSGFTYVGLSNPTRQFKIRYKVNALGTLVLEGFCLLSPTAYGGPFPLNTKILVFTIPTTFYYTTNSVRYAPLIAREGRDDVIGVIRIAKDSGAGGLPGIEVLFNTNVGAASQVYFEAHFERSTGSNP